RRLDLSVAVHVDDPLAVFGHEPVSSLFCLFSMHDRARESAGSGITGPQLPRIPGGRRPPGIVPVRGARYGCSRSGLAAFHSSSAAFTSAGSKSLAAS